MIPLKRRKVSQTSGRQHDVSKFPHVCVFLLERKMGSTRRAFLTKLGRTKGFHIAETFNSSITHLVSENNSGDEVQTWLDKQTSPEASTALRCLDISWFTESMTSGHPVEVLHRHVLKVEPKPEGETPEEFMKNYACQRRTPLKHHNLFLTEALDVLSLNAEFSENEGRSVAFRRAASVLKALSYKVSRMEDLRGLPCLGDHSQRVIQEILEDGFSKEVETTTESEQFQTMKALTGIFGVGVRTADRWYREGLRSPAELISTGQQLNNEQQAGLLYYDDLLRHVTKAEADAISEIVKNAVDAVLPGAIVQMMGGFRRGKEMGHDVDFLITHPEEGKEERLMPKITNWLDAKGFLLYQKTTRNSYLEKKDGPGRPSHSMDRFERCLSIFRLHGSSERFHPTIQSDGAEAEAERAEERGWRAVRVDLVVSPYSQFAFATLGWTGSKLFERELRRWAKKEKNMSLSSHALYDNKQNRYLRANTEEEIFAHLGLEFIPPCERNA